MEEQFFSIIQGNSKDLSRQLATRMGQQGRHGFVHCVVTSPPYWKQRQYGMDGSELGNERTVEEYVHNLADIFDGIPLHDDGSLWVNLGDKREDGLVLAPERFAIEMVARGWKLIDKVVWTKTVVLPEKGQCIGHCMIEPAPLRLNGNAWEVFYRFAKSKRPWADTCAIRLPRENVAAEPYLPPNVMETVTSTNGRHRPNAWQIGMGQTTQKHYAVFPPMLCEVPIAMTCPLYTSSDGRTLEERIFESVEYDEKRKDRSFGKYRNAPKDLAEASGRQDTGRHYVAKMPQTTGFSDVGPERARGVVLDPFCGTGTVGEVALRMGRSFIGIDLYEKNYKMSNRRCRNAMLVAMDVNFRAERM